MLISAVCIDATVLHSKKAALQNAADSAVLAAATSGEKKRKNLEEVATSIAEQNFDASIFIKLKVNGDKVEVTATYRHPYIFGSIIGRKSSNIQAISEALIPSGAKLNLALALDVTESMDGPRMTALKDAATTLVQDIAVADGGEGNAKISIVPFADYVRIDMGYAGQNWLNVEPDHMSTWDVLDEENSTNCVQMGSGENRYTECDVPVYREETALIQWNGCMASRPNNHHKTPAFANSPMQGNAGRTNCNGSYPVMSVLSNDYTDIENQIQALSAVGKTYLPAGIIWAWRTLDKNLPFTEAANGDDVETQNTLLLMTDGSNTAALNGTRPGFDGVYHWGTGSGAAAIAADRLAADVLTAELCTAIKAENIKIVTVAFQVTDVSTKAMLKACASTNQDYYDVITAADLTYAFKDIGSGITNVRITR